MNRYSSSFLLTFFLYSILTASVVFSSNNIQNLQTTPPKPTTNLKVKIVTTKEKKIEKNINKEKLTKKKEKPLKKKTIKPKKLTKLKKIIKKIEKVKKVEKIIQNKNTPKFQSSKKILKKKPLAKLDEKLNHNKINKQKQLYFSQVKQTINKNKIYPKVAIRRSIEGSVKIKFTLTKYGELVSFNILKGQKIFKKSIAKAIQKSFPIKPPQNIFKENLDLFVTLNYKLY